MSLRNVRYGQIDGWMDVLMKEDCKWLLWGLTLALEGGEGVLLVRGHACNCCHP